MSFLLRLRGLAVHDTLTHFFQSNGFLTLERSQTSIVYGLIGCPWKAGGDLVQMTEADQWTSFVSTNHAKMAISFYAVDEGGNGTLLSTETRVHIEGLAARRKFAVYWFFVRPLSSLLRRIWLKEVERPLAGRS